MYPEYLGDRTFTRDLGSRFALVVGEMARGITTPDMVIAAVRAGMMAFFGSAGLAAPQVEQGLRQISENVEPGRSWGANLIHSPQDPAAEAEFAELAIRYRVPAVSASAFMRLTPSVVQLSAQGLTTTPDGAVVRARHLFAKISRPEVARHFLAPAPENMLHDLVAAGRLTADEARLARQIPVADHLTVEADSGGHTDNRPFGALFPGIKALSADARDEHGYATTARVGLAGGLGSPAAVAAAFAAGADYVVTGSVNQSAVESGLSAAGRQLLAAAEVADVAMAPAADMFELGVQVQVLKRGTLFAQRGKRLYEVYRSYPGLDQLPSDVRTELETKVIGARIDDVWAETAAYFAQRNPAELTRADADPKYRMALVFRWYLFNGAQWAREGLAERRTDFQIWCGPAMGAFNDWVRGSWLEPLANRDVAQISLNLLEGAASVTRAQQLRAAGVTVGPEAFDFRPRRMAVPA